MSVVVTAVFTPASGAREALTAALREGIPAVHAEAGCLLYAIHDADDGTIVMLEKWTSREDLDAHASGEAVKRLNELIEGLIAQPVVVTTMLPIAAGTDEQGLI